jgi:hypothetical protein
MTRQLPSTNENISCSRHVDIFNLLRESLIEVAYISKAYPHAGLRISAGGCHCSSDSEVRMKEVERK